MLRAAEALISQWQQQIPFSTSESAASCWERQLSKTTKIGELLTVRLRETWKRGQEGILDFDILVKYTFFSNITALFSTDRSIDFRA